MKLPDLIRDAIGALALFAILAGSLYLAHGAGY